MSAGDDVRCEAFAVPRQQFEAALLTLELEFVKAKGPGAPQEEVDAPDLAKQLQKRFASQARRVRTSERTEWPVCAGTLARCANPGASMIAHAVLQPLRCTQVFTEDQKVTFEYLGNNYLTTVTGVLVEAQAEKTTARRGCARTCSSSVCARACTLVCCAHATPRVSPRSMLVPKTAFVFQARGGGGIKVINQRSSVAPNLFKSKEVSFEKLGIGGMDRQFEEIFRRAFASRVFPPHVVKRLGITHVKGMLLFGPPVRRCIHGLHLQMRV